MNASAKCRLRNVTWGFRPMVFYGTFRGAFAQGRAALLPPVPSPLAGEGGEVARERG